MTREDFEGRILNAQARMYRVARSYLRSEQDCMDAVAEAVLRAWQRQDSLRSEVYFDTWLIRIVIRECINIHRRQRRMTPVEQLPEKPVSPDRAAEALRDALDALPQKLRTAAVLHYMEGYAVADIARVLRVPKGTVASRLHLARERLRALLKEEIE